MRLTVYNNKSNHNVVNKQLEKINDINFKFKDDVSIIRPTLILENYNGGNYCYIEGLNRYYFIEDVILMKHNLVMVKCYIDVLMSYATDIINNTFYSDDGVLTIIDSNIDFNSIYDVSKFILILGV